MWLGSCGEHSEVGIFENSSFVILSASEGSRFFGLRPQNDAETNV